METIVLASASPRRHEYFRLLGIPFIVKPSTIEETWDENLPLEDAPRAIATRKALSVAESLQTDGVGTQADNQAGYPADSPRWVFGADTIVAIDGRVFGKPKNRAQARLMLSSLQNRVHRVISGIVLCWLEDRRVSASTVVSEVRFAPMSNAEIEWHLDTGEWEGAAGAYKAQGLASCFIAGVQGSFSNVVGLPLREFYTLLRESGYEYGAAAS
ncbi:MAG: Maf family protein [Treponema sp.]|jgi:septum formation protein|nr:Maf family protein [Treponema sp.]